MSVPATKEPLWCRDERLRLGWDVLVEETPAFTLVRCVFGMHNGQWILWAPNGDVRHIGSEAFVRLRLPVTP